MSFFVRAASVSKPVSRPAFYTSLGAGALLTAASVAQLFKFEEFPAVLAGYPLPGGLASSVALAALLVSVEVFAVPYLLFMRLSPLMRAVSFVCGLISCLIWLVLGSYLVVQGREAMNNGLLGATLEIHSGWAALLFSVLIAAGLFAARSTLLSHVSEQR